MLAETKVIEKKEEDALSVKSRGEYSNELTYFHVGADHNWERSVMRIVVDIYLEEKGKISPCSCQGSRWGSILVRRP